MNKSILLLRKISKIRGILLSKGYTIIPKDFKALDDDGESFVNRKFRVDIYQDGKVESEIEYHHPRFISLCNNFWLNKQ